MFQKMGKSMLRKVFSEEANVPASMIREAGEYLFYGNKEVYRFGGHTIVNNADGVALYSPCEGFFRNDLSATRYIKRRINTKR